jgi:hypothetical protein
MIAASALRTVGRAAGERVTGIGPGPFRAGMAAAITGTAAAALTYKALRSDSLGSTLKTNGSEGS